MKILYIATYEGLSGASYSLLGLMSEVRNAGNDVSAIVLKPGKITELLEKKNIPYKIIRGYPWVVQISSYSNAKQRAAWQIKKIYNHIAERRILKIIKKEHIDIVHINASTAGVGSIAAKKAGVPLVWHLREFVEEDLEKKFWNRKKVMQRLAYADAVIAISESVKEKFKQFSPDLKYNVIYNGIDHTPYLSGREKTLFSEKETIITIVGRIDPTKGHKELLSAVKMLRERGVSSFKVRIIGKSQDPVFEESLRKYVSDNQLMDHVSFLGFRSDVPKYLLESDITVVSSLMEAFGRVTAEAMLAGNVVIGANTGGTKELLGNGYGILYNSGDAADLADKIEQVLRNKDEYLPYGERAREFAFSTFTAKINAENIMKVYKNLKKAGS